MIGRASQGRPWFPGQVATYFETGVVPAEPSTAERLNVARTHFTDMLNLYGVDTGIRNARKHMGWYAVGLPNSNGFRNLINNTMDPAVVESAIQRYFGNAVPMSAA